MKNLTNYAIVTIAACIILSCSSTRNTSGRNNNTTSETTGTDDTNVRPRIKTPNTGIINASGDGLTPGINPATANRGSNAGMTATDIATNAINKAKANINYTVQPLDSMNDERFISRAVTNGVMEIRMGKIAQKRTKNGAVKAYATMLINDHNQANIELKALSSNKGIPIPNGDSANLNTIQPVSDSSNTAMANNNNFDLEYIKMMIYDHQKEIQLYEAGSKSTDISVKTFANKFLPVLKKHLSQAQDLLKTIDQQNAKKEN